MWASAVFSLSLLVGVAVTAAEGQDMALALFSPSPSPNSETGYIDSGLDFCWRTKYMRGVGKLPNRCPSGFPDHCGTVGLRAQCCKVCPEPEPGFNAGNRKGKKRFCEYSPKAGGPSKQVMTSYTNSVCGAFEPEEKAGLCYEACDAGYAAEGAFPTECWIEPPKHLDYGWIKCGLGAARNAGVCVVQVIEAVMGALESALFVCSLGTSAATAPATAQAKAPMKLLGAVNKVMKGADTMKDVAKVAKVTDAIKDTAKVADTVKDVAKMADTVKDVAKMADTVKDVAKAAKVADAFKDAAKAADVAKDSVSIWSRVKKFGTALNAFTDPIQAGAMAGKRVRKMFGIVGGVAAKTGKLAKNVQATQKIAKQVSNCRALVNFLAAPLHRIGNIAKQVAQIGGKTANTASRLQAVATFRKQLGFITKSVGAALFLDDNGSDSFRIDRLIGFLQVGDKPSMTTASPLEGADTVGNTVDTPAYSFDTAFAKSLCLLSGGVEAADDMVQIFAVPEMDTAWSTYRPTCEKNDLEIIESIKEAAEADSAEAQRLEKKAEELSEELQTQGVSRTHLRSNDNDNKPRSLRSKASAPAATRVLDTVDHLTKVAGMAAQVVVASEPAAMRVLDTVDQLTTVAEMAAQVVVPSELVEAPASSLLEIKKKDHCALAEALEEEEEAEMDDELREQLEEFAPTAQGAAAIAKVNKEWNRIKNWVDEGVDKGTWAIERLNKKLKVLQDFNKKLESEGKMSLVDQDAVTKAEAETASSKSHFLVDPFMAVRTAIGLASILDPTGISSNTAAYMYPNCCMYFVEGADTGCKRVKGYDARLKKRLERKAKKEKRKSDKAKIKGCKQALKANKKDQRQKNRIARLEKNNPAKLQRVKARKMRKSSNRETKELNKLEKDLKKGQRKRKKHARKTAKKETRVKKKADKQTNKAAQKLRAVAKKNKKKEAKTVKKQGKKDNKYNKKVNKAANKVAKKAAKAARRRRL